MHIFFISINCISYYILSKSKNGNASLVLVIYIHNIPLRFNQTYLKNKNYFDLVYSKISVNISKKYLILERLFNYKKRKYKHLTSFHYLFNTNEKKQIFLNITDIHIFFEL